MRQLKRINHRQNNYTMNDGYVDYTYIILYIYILLERSHDTRKVLGSTLSQDIFSLSLDILNTHDFLKIIYQFDCGKIIKLYPDSYEI